MVGLLAVIDQLRVPLPRLLARGLMQVGSPTMFIYLVHVPVGATVLDFRRHLPLLALLAITAISITVSIGLKLAYDTTAMRILSRIWQVSASFDRPPAGFPDPVSGAQVSGGRSAMCAGERSCRISSGPAFITSEHHV